MAGEDGWLDILVNAAAGGATVCSLMDLDDENTPTTSVHKLVAYGARQAPVPKRSEPGKALSAPK